MTDIANVWDNPTRPWPSVVYVETTNRCNANCAACLNDKVQRKRHTMDQWTFERVAKKISLKRLKIGAMFCFGEPLLDPGIFQKYRYARRIGVLAPHVGLNTNVSLLTREKFDDVVSSTTNITLSFFNVGKEFERMTCLDWEQCYANACAFIAYRDQFAPNYPVFIGVNRVRGHDRPAVERAFANFRVLWAADAECWFDGGTKIEGAINRTRMYHDWRCDGYKGAIQVKPNGDAEFCAYDIMGTPQGGETLFGHFLGDPWETLERNFRAAWRAGSTLCRRCDYWTKGRAVIAECGGDVARETCT